MKHKELPLATNELICDQFLYMFVANKRIRNPAHYLEKNKIHKNWCFCDTRHNQTKSSIKDWKTNDRNSISVFSCRVSTVVF